MTYEVMTDDEIEQLRWEVPPLPDTVKWNEPDYYRSREYLQWYNGLDRAVRRLHSPKVVEARIEGLERKGHKAYSRFGLLTDSGTHMMNDTELALRNDRTLTPQERRIIGKQLKTQQQVIDLMRSLVDEDDVVRIYSTLTEQAIATAEPKLLEVWLKYMVGLPAQQIDVKTTNVADVLRVIADQAEKNRQEYVVVDAQAKRETHD
jgi:hypothetical protein